MGMFTMILVSLWYKYEYPYATLHIDCHAISAFIATCTIDGYTGRNVYLNMDNDIHTSRNVYQYHREMTAYTISILNIALNDWQ